MSKIIAILLIVLGEVMTISAEVYGAKIVSSVGGSGIKAIIFGAIGGAVLVVGYIMGIRAFKEIWTVTVISVAAIIILEPTINYLVFQEIPTTGQTIGMILGTLGLIAALF